MLMSGCDYFMPVLTSGLTSFSWAFPCTKHNTGDGTIKIPLEERFRVYAAPKEINCDEDVTVPFDIGWSKRVLRALNVRVSIGIPYTHKSNTLCERQVCHPQIRLLKETVRIWCRSERTKD